MPTFREKIARGWREMRGNIAVETAKWLGGSTVVGAIFKAVSQAAHRVPVDWWLFVFLFFFGVFLIGFSLYRGEQRHPKELSEQPTTPVVLPKLDGEIYRIIRSPKTVHSKLIRQFWESSHPGEPYTEEIDVLVELYIVNTSMETQYIRDFCGTVEIHGSKVQLARENNFDAYTLGEGHDYEYCLGEDSKADPLKPLFTHLPMQLEPRKPLDGWVRFVVKVKDYETLPQNLPYSFALKDSLDGEHPISRAASKSKETPINNRRKGIK